MLARENSLKKFSRNFAHSTSSALFIVNSRPSSGFKLIVTVSKKTCPLAVDRNRSRRLVTAAFLKLNSQTNVNHEVAILVRRNLKETPLETVEAELKKLL